MFSPAEIAARIAEGEGPRIEFKRQLPRDERTARSLCAFANGRGGLLLVGVADRGFVTGVREPAHVAERLARIAREALEPKVDLEARTVRIAQCDVVAARVPASPRAPHAVVRPDGEREVVVRVGASNRAADRPTIAALRVRGARPSLDAFEKRVVAWVRAHAGAGPATPAAFARAQNVGLDRARRAFVRVETNGVLVAHGARRARSYALP